MPYRLLQCLCKVAWWDEWISCRDLLSQHSCGRVESGNHETFMNITSLQSAAVFLKSYSSMWVRWITFVSTRSVYLFCSGSYMSLCLVRDCSRCCCLNVAEGWTYKIRTRKRMETATWRTEKDWKFRSQEYWGRGFKSRSRHACMSAFHCVVLLACVGTSLEMGWSPIQGVLTKCLNCLIVTEFKSESEQTRGTVPWEQEQEQEQQHQLPFQT
jgi:hypothetical protein